MSVFSWRAPLRRVAVLAALLLGGASVTLATAHAQSPKRTPVIGLLGTTPQGARILEVFKQGLREGGWVEGETVRLESRWAEGPPELPGPYRVFFTSFDCNEPPHVHVEREDSTCKFWLEPVELARTHGFNARELDFIRRLINAHHSAILEAWHGHCG